MPTAINVMQKTKWDFDDFVNILKKDFREFKKDGIVINQDTVIQLLLANNDVWDTLRTKAKPFMSDSDRKSEENRLREKQRAAQWKTNPDWLDEVNQSDSS